MGSRGSQSFALNGEPINLNAKQSSFDTLTARVAILEATLASRPAGVGHNRGPDLDENLSVDEPGIKKPDRSCSQRQSQP
ncbi:hypothetical protein, partial [Bradyrhizobium sp.]|uniref:hypothetical protein n=1 Tax=Bradyrhizobium sp. TaxID=376 RepID=UPI003C1F3D0F